VIRTINRSGMKSLALDCRGDSLHLSMSGFNGMQSMSPNQSRRTHQSRTMHGEFKTANSGKLAMVGSKSPQAPYRSSADAAQMGDLAGRLTTSQEKQHSASINQSPMTSPRNHSDNVVREASEPNSTNKTADGDTKLEVTIETALVSEDPLQ